MKRSVLALLLGLTLVAAAAQGTLQFNQVLKIGNITQTVPDGKVWKITSVYGSENACIMYSNSQNGSYSWKKMISTSYYVDGVLINSSLVDQITKRFCNSSSCTTCDDGFSTGAFDASVPANPNILPMWLSADATLASGRPNTFLSVIEFNIVP